MSHLRPGGARPQGKKATKKPQTIVVCGLSFSLENQCLSVESADALRLGWRESPPRAQFRTAMGYIIRSIVCVPFLRIFARASISRILSKCQPLFLCFKVNFWELWNSVCTFD